MKMKRLDEYYNDPTDDDDINDNDDENEDVDELSRYRRRRRRDDVDEDEEYCHLTTNEFLKNSKKKDVFGPETSCYFGT